MKIDNRPVSYDEFLTICRRTKDQFAFLETLGLRLTKEQWPTGDSYRDGFQLTYTGSPVSVVVEYYDMELVIWFQKADGDKIPYFFIDHELLSNRSGFAGWLFPRNKLAGAVNKMAEDIRPNYKRIISGDEDLWNRLIALLHSPREKKKLP